MQLRVARLCLDCDEIHEDVQCPVCASEAFAFLTQWITVEDRKTRRNPVRKPSVPVQPSTATKPAVARYLRRGAYGLALVATAQWLWHATRPDADGNGRTHEH